MLAAPADRRPRPHLAAEALAPTRASPEAIRRPRLRFLFEHQLSNVVFVLVIAGAFAAFLATPLPASTRCLARGVVLLSLAVPLKDLAIVIAALVVGLARVVLEVALGSAAVHGISHLL